MAKVLPGSSDPTASGPIASDLPCDAATLLSTYCWSCHGPTPTSQAPMSMVTAADLTAPAPTDPTKTVAALAVTRMQDTKSPMPPLPASAVPAAQIATFQAWVDAGMPSGSCQSASDPYGTAPVCTSGQNWTGGDRESSLMHPGVACISCHSISGGPRFALAGTVYPTAHEPDDCNGKSGIQVVITGSDGSSVTLNANSAGNFYSRGGVTFPYTAKVVQGGNERAMTTPQSDGDCNGCHTENGDNGAPGRIMAP
jgi:hypothetical protein